jgi:hypothetical protein
LTSNSTRLEQASACSCLCGAGAWNLLCGQSLSGACACCLSVQAA